MTDFKKAKIKIRRRVLHQSAMGGKTHFYTSIPDPLNQCYIDGKVNDTLFRLIYTLLAHSADFWITRQYLEERFSPSTLKKYLPLIIKAKIVEVDQVTVGNGGKPANVYHTNHPDDWDMEIICEVPRGGQVACPSNTSPVKDSERHTNTSDVNPSDVNPSHVKDIINTNSNQTNLNQTKKILGRKNSPQNAGGKKPIIKMDVLYKAMRNCYSNFVAGEITRGLVAEMLLVCDDRERVLNLIKWVGEERQNMQYKPEHDQWWVDQVQLELQAAAH